MQLGRWMGLSVASVDRIYSGTGTVPMRTLRAAILTTVFVAGPCGFGGGTARAQDSSTLTVPSASTASIAGIWRGYYYYSAKLESVEFQFRFEDANGSCLGRSEEKNTFGTKQSDKLYADLKCTTLQLTPGEKIEIFKRYDKTAGAAHDVHYVGTVWPDLEQVTGQWEIGIYSGTFVIRR